MVAEVFLVFDAVVYDAVGEDEQVGGEGEGPGAGDGCCDEWYQPWKGIDKSIVIGMFVRGTGGECVRSILGTGTPIPIEELMIAGWSRKAALNEYRYRGSYLQRVTVNWIYS